jgi:hypothetical protein
MSSAAAATMRRLVAAPRGVSLDSSSALADLVTKARLPGWTIGAGLPIDHALDGFGRQLGHAGAQASWIGDLRREHRSKVDLVVLFMFLTDCGSRWRRSGAAGGATRTRFWRELAGGSPSRCSYFAVRRVFLVRLSVIEGGPGRRQVASLLCVE